tara:strand:+ start:11923 stop:12582 length:660 start_codon:yes stop_codon:yes gene_type:complete
MSDSIYLKGFGQAIREEGDSITLTSGKIAQRVTKWWGSGLGKVCVPSSVFAITTDEGTKLSLVVADPAGSRLRIKHDGKGNLELSDFFGLERAGLFPENNLIPSALINDYVFPSSPRGVVTCISVGTLPKDSKIGDVLLSGKGIINMSKSSTASYTVTATGDSTDNVSTLSVTDKNAKIDENKITFSKAGTYTIKVSVSSETASDSPKTASISVTVKSS